MIRPLNVDELDQLFAIREVAFLDWTDYSKPENRQIHLDRLKYRYGSFNGDALAATASWYPFNMYLHGKLQPVWGLASVATAGEYRRKGHVAKLLNAGLEMMNRQGVGWCLEYPFDPRFYGRYGWSTVSNGNFYEVPSGWLRRDEVSAKRIGLEQVEQAHEIYDTWASRYNFAFGRDDKIQESWRYLFGKAPWHDQSQRRFAYVMDGAYCVAIISRKDGGKTLHVLDWGHSTPAGFQALLSFWGGFHGQVDKVRVQLPSDSPLQHEWSEYVVPHPHPLQARIVSAQAALSGIPADQFFSIALAVTDDFCGWNNQTYRVKGDGEFSSAEITSDEPDATIDVRGLARLLSGTIDVGTALHYGELDAANDKVWGLQHLEIGPAHMSLSDYF